MGDAPQLASKVMVPSVQNNPLTSKICAIVNCESHTAGVGKGRLYKFPEDAEVCNKWIDFVMEANGYNNGPRFVPDRGTAVCDRHFRPGDYTLVTKKASKTFYSSSKEVDRMALWPGAVPSMLPPPPTTGGGSNPGGGGRWTPHPPRLGCGGPQGSVCAPKTSTTDLPQPQYSSQRLYREQLRSPQIGCTLLTKLLEPDCDVSPSGDMPSPEAEDNPFSVKPIVIEPLIEESATCQSTLNDKPYSRYPSYSDIGWSADTKPSYGEVPTPAELPNTITLALRASPQPSMASPPPDSLSCYAQSVPAYCPSSHPGFPPQMYQYIYQTACYQSVSVQKQPSYPAFPIQGQTGSSGQHHQMVQYGGSQQHQMVQFGGPQQHQMVQYGQTTCRVPQVPTKGHSSHRRQPGAMGSGLTGYSSLVPIMGPMTYSTPSPQTMDTYPNTNCYSTGFTSQHFGSPVNNFPAIASQLFNSSTQCQRHGVNSNKAQPQPLDFAPVVGLPPLNPCPAERIGTQNRPIVIAPDSRILQESDGLNRNPQDDDVAMMRQSYGVDIPTRPPQCKDSKGTGMSGRKREINISGKCFFKMQPRVGLIEEVKMIMASDEHDHENTLSAIQQRTKAYLRLEKHLPRVVQIAVSELKAQALVSEKKKKMFFDSLTNVHLLTVSSKCDSLPKRFRGIIFSHLGDQLPCSKKTLNYHTWFLKASRVEEEIRDYLERLRETVQKEMPEQVNHYQWDCETTKKWQHQQMTMLSPGGVTPPPEVPTVCDDAVCRHVLPAKKYTWSQAARTLVQDILEKKRSTYSKQSKVPHVDRLAHYVNVAIVDIWPEGWMDRETLFSEFPTVLAAKQPKKQ